jgi:acetylornithine deacetylase/succinyl-diaminopimelate desuccinylase-like protein
MHPLSRRLAPVALLCCVPLAVWAATPSKPANDPSNVLARGLFKQLIEINTTDSEPGSVTAAAEAMQKALLDAGFPAADLHVIGPNDRKKNLVARLPGTGKHKPVLLIGHLDVVEARREDWTTNPFEFVEKDGYFYGRGTQDMKNGDAILVATLIRLKKENFRPSRDIILALTADEEGGKSNGVDWLFKNHRELVDAEFVLNHDGASVPTDKGKPVAYEMGSSEKVYADYLLTTTNPGGHSSRPTNENAIYELTEGLNRLAKYDFPFELTTVTRAYYQSMSKIEKGQRSADMLAITKDPPDMEAAARISKDPTDHSTLRTTCVATRLSGGHANNALPQRAQANVNCRILPGHSPEEVRQDIIKILASPKIAVQYVSDDGQVMDKASDRKGFPPPPLRPEVMKPLQKLVNEFWPGLTIVPTMSIGASDDVWVNAAGLTSYTVTGISIDRDDERAHGQDERLRAESFYTGNEFFYQYMKALTAK